MRNRLALVLPITCCACITASSGREFDIAAASKIKAGASTKADVVTLLGEPFRKDIGGAAAYAGAQETWTYYYREIYVTPLPVSQSDRTQDNSVVVMFNGDKVLTCIKTEASSQGTREIFGGGGTRVQQNCDGTAFQSMMPQLPAN